MGSLYIGQNSSNQICLITGDPQKPKIPALVDTIQASGFPVISVVGAPEHSLIEDTDAGAFVVDGTSDFALVWVKHLVESRPSIPIAMICDGTAIEVCMQGLQMGASSVLSSKTKTGILTMHLTEVLKGGAVLIPKIAREVLRRMRDGEPIAAMDQDEKTTVALTERELQLLDLLNKGLKQKEMASVLGISTNTVSTLISRAYKKLGVTSRIQATQLAQSLGLIR